MATNNPILTAAQSSIVAPSSSRLAAVEEALTASTTRISESIASLESGQAKTRGLTNVIADSIADLTSAAQITKLASDTASLQAQNKTIAAFEASGGAEVQAQQMATLKEDNARVASLLNDRQAILSEEFTGIELIDGIIGQFRTVQTDLEINAASQQLAQTQQEIAGVHAATESFAATNALTKKTLNKGVIQANYNALAAEGAIKAAEAQLSGINSNASAMARLVQADAQGVSNLVQSFRLEGEVEERALKRERIAFQREQMAFSREKWKVELPAAQIALEKATLALGDSESFTPERRSALRANALAATKRHNDLVETENQLVSAVQNGQALAGTPIEERETIVFGLKQSGAVGDKYARLQELGGSPDLILGADPAEAVESLQLIAPSGNITETPGITALRSITELQAAVYAAAGKVPKDDETLAADFNATAQAYADSKAANIVTGDATNPYQAAPMGVLMDSFESIKQSELYQKVLKPLQMHETDPQKILDAAVSGVRSKTVSPEAAARGIETIFEAAALYNNTMSGGFRRVGLPNQISYNAQIEAPLTNMAVLGIGIESVPDLALFGVTAALPGVSISERGEVLAESIAKTAALRTQIVDLMDGTAVQKAVVKLLSSLPKEAPVATPTPE